MPSPVVGRWMSHPTFQSHPDSHPGHFQEINETTKTEKGRRVSPPLFRQGDCQKIDARIFRAKFLRQDWKCRLCRSHNQFIEMKDDRDRKHKTESSQPQTRRLADSPENAERLQATLGSESDNCLRLVRQFVNNGLEARVVVRGGSRLPVLASCWLLVRTSLRGDIRALSGCGIEHIECRGTVDATTARAYSHVWLAK